MTFIGIIFFIFEKLVFTYALFIMVSYLWMVFSSFQTVRKTAREAKMTEYKSIISSPLLPSITVIAPAYNEAPTIVDNIRSLLSLHYVALEVIIVNDGSKDDTFNKAVESYDLYKTDLEYHPHIHTAKVRGVYKSNNPSFQKLTFIDKENGGKADAINVGINMSKTDYFACIDVDCIIDEKAFLKLVKPVLENPNERVIAVGGIVFPTNNCTISNGRLLEVRAAKNWEARFQTLEYFRAFLSGRTAWAKHNGLLLISGAFGLFERELVMEVGGYYHSTVGEDMELVMRMHSAMLEKGEPYKVSYLPEPLCWTEVPNSFNVLGRQRNRWTRGTIECLLLHKKMCLKKKYGFIGMVSYPYWFLAEWAAPLVEAGGVLFVLVLTIFGFINWPVFFALLVLVYAFSVFNSIMAIFLQAFSYGYYNDVKSIKTLILTALIEPFYFHPRATWWALKGNWDFIRKNNVGWGEMTREGFSG